MIFTGSARRRRAPVRAASWLLALAFVLTGTARALHIGGTTQVWEIRIVNDQGKLSCVARITMAVIRG